MVQHKTQGAFLRALVTHTENEAGRLLHDRLLSSEREGKCIRRAMFLVAVLLMLSLAGLAYCAILRPEVLGNSPHLLIQTLLVLVLGSLISQIAFLGYLFTHRTSVNRLHVECRRLVLALAHTRVKDSPSSLGEADSRSALRSDEIEHSVPRA